MRKPELSRRRFLATTAASTAALAMPHVRGAHAAGRLSIGFWDHWVPGANKASQVLCEEWGAKEKVEISIDYITSQGNKNLLTIAAESQARSGHDIFAFPTWEPQAHARNLEPVDDIMTELIKQNGAVNPTVEYLARDKGRWLAVPATVGSQIKGPCSRIDLMKQHAGIDVVAMYPAGSAPKADAWTLDAMLKAAEACHKAGHPFGIGLGTTEDNVDTAGSIFQSYGAALVDDKGTIKVKSDPVRQALEYYKRLSQFLPPDAPAWDNASNNKYLVSGKGALIMNPPQRWAVAKRDAPKVAEQCWTLGMPGRAEGPLAPFLPFLWGCGRSGRTSPPPRACSRTCRRARRPRRWSRRAPATTCPRSRNSPTSRRGPRKGRRRARSITTRTRTSTTLSVAAAPAPPKIAHQIYTQAIQTKMVVRFMQGEPLEKTLAWAESESRRLHAHLSLRASARPSPARCGGGKGGPAGRQPLS